jgi:hypothetical protein
VPIPDASFSHMASMIISKGSPYKRLFTFQWVLIWLCYIKSAGHGSREVACCLFARSEAVTVGSNPTQGMDV